jgi:hypothetical protein
MRTSARLVQVLAAETGGDDVDGLDVPERRAGVLERGLHRAVRALGRAAHHLDDLGDRH